jgi:hypothetical protein
VCVCVWGGGGAQAGAHLTAGVQQREAHPADVPLHVQHRGVARQIQDDCNMGNGGARQDWGGESFGLIAQSSPGTHPPPPRHTNIYGKDEAYQSAPRRAPPPIALARCTPRWSWGQLTHARLCPGPQRPPSANVGQWRCFMGGGGGGGGGGHHPPPPTSTPDPHESAPSFQHR